LMIEYDLFLRIFRVAVLKKFLSIGRRWLVGIDGQLNTENGNFSSRFSEIDRRIKNDSELVIQDLL
jgi:hypothetical protein